MSKIKFHQQLVLLIIYFLLFPSLVLAQQIGMPACYSDLEGHYKIASEYLKDKKPTYSVVKESAEYFGGCFNVNRQSTKFDIKNAKGQVVGEISVDGRTNEVIGSNIIFNYPYNIFIIFISILIIVLIVIIIIRKQKEKISATQRS